MTDPNHTYLFQKGKLPLDLRLCIFSAWMTYFLALPQSIWPLQKKQWTNCAHIHLCIIIITHIVYTMCKVCAQWSLCKMRTKERFLKKHYKPRHNEHVWYFVLSCMCYIKFHGMSSVKEFHGQNHFMCFVYIHLYCTQICMHHAQIQVQYMTFYMLFA